MFTTRRRRHLLGIAVVALLVMTGCQSDDEPSPSATDPGDGSESPDEQSPDTDITLNDDTLRVDFAARDLQQPTSLAFVEDGFLVAEKATGRIRLVRDGQVTGDVIDLAVNSFDERGLLGIATHPQFPEEPFVYVHWTWRGEGEGEEQLLGDDTDEATDVPELGNRIDRFRWDDEQLTFDRNLVQFPANTLPSDTTGRVRGNHDAGPLTFGPDGKLYVQMGDQNLRGQLQNIADGPPPDDEHFAGVILRLNDDGSIPEDNPFFAAGQQMGGNVGENVQKVFAYGIRNSFGLAFHPTSGALWQTENGDDTFDEVNVFPPGANSGWIQLMGPPEEFTTHRQMELDSEDGLDVEEFPPSRLAPTAQEAQDKLFSLPGSRFVSPALSFVYPPALTAIAFVPDDTLGATSAGTVWLGTVLTNSLLRYSVDEAGTGLRLDGDLSDGVVHNTEKGDLTETEDAVVGTGFNVVTDIKLGPDGALYVVSLGNGAVYRLSAAA